MFVHSLRESVWIVDYNHEVGDSLRQKATIV